MYLKVGTVASDPKIPYQKVLREGSVTQPVVSS